MLKLTLLDEHSGRRVELPGRFQVVRIRGDTCMVDGEVLLVRELPGWYYREQLYSDLTIVVG